MKKVHNYFKYYSKGETQIVEEWLKSLKGLTNSFTVKPENTGLHDIRVLIQDGPNFLVEVKTDEPYWFDKTGNIGLDYYSSFNFKSGKNDFNSFWIKPEQLEDLKTKIVVIKKGKLFTCDSEVQLFYVHGRLMKAYDNKKLQDGKFVKYLEEKFNLRINDKRRYGLKDSWQSAAYYVNPLTDYELIKCEIKDYLDLLNATNKK